MDLHQLAQEIDFSGFSAEPAITPDGVGLPGPLDLADSSPVPDFWDWVPEKLVDPRTGKEVTVSQSFTKALKKVEAGELCPKEFYHTYVIKSHWTPSSEARELGVRFEYLLTGARDYHGNVPGPILTATGKESIEESRISGNVIEAKIALMRNGIDLKKAAVSVSVQRKCLSGTADLGYNESGIHVIDLKYSGLRGDYAKRHEFGWHPETIATNYSHQVQARFYTLLFGAERFWFVVFDSRKDYEGDHDIFELTFSEKAMNEAKNMILNAIQIIQERLKSPSGFDPEPKCERCRTCPVQECEARIEYPKIQSINI